MEKDIEIFPNRSFGLIHKTTDKPNRLNFQLHNHDDLYEIMLFLGGDCEFQVEGNTYKLAPQDIVLTRPFELHHIVCLTEKSYDRIILFIRSSYFTENNCEELLEVFSARELGTGNLISADAENGASAECMKRLYRYTDEGAYDIAEHVITELLYLLNNAKKHSADVYTKNKCLREIIVYINNHLEENLSLNLLADRFFLSKHYMCRMFRQSTGYTIGQYISHKRIMLAQELHRQGQSWLIASLNAGFGNYATFYRAYLRQTGEAPRNSAAH